MPTPDNWDKIMNAREPTKPFTSLGLSEPLSDEEGPRIGAKSYTITVTADAPKIQHKLAETAISIGCMLLDKNQKYGNSALDPLRVHSQASPTEQIKVRADDKLSRLRSAQADDAEDALLDYIGYMILLYIAEKHND